MTNVKVCMKMQVAGQLAQDGESVQKPVMRAIICKQSC